MPSKQTQSYMKEIFGYAAKVDIALLTKFKDDLVEMAVEVAVATRTSITASAVSGSELSGSMMYPTSAVNAFLQQSATSSRGLQHHVPGLRRLRG
ncbi:hypothetical protein G7Y89_g13824 [Cudoniella acicularis]|uniref:Uncharacterized protein n=1 Tax=Cudoniella acicularis TaxID=354080 RepID=A0A8H4R8J4_9HELO|nr:hypothetical protein G7Y89_g13824 [Cudoniella acicularis]